MSTPLQSSSEPSTRIDAAVTARGLTKRFGDFTAVDGIDLDVRPGETFAFLGANGAGKTSTMRMIATVSPVSDGTLRCWAWTRPPMARPSVRGWAWCHRTTTSTSN